MSTTDPFRMTDQLDQSLLQVIGARLEARGNHPRFATMLQEYLDAMHIDTAQTVLDRGCGTGVAARHRAAPVVCRSSLFKDAADRVFFGATNYYSYVAKRP